MYFFGRGFPLSLVILTFSHNAQSASPCFERFKALVGIHSSSTTPLEVFPEIEDEPPAFRRRYVTSTEASDIRALVAKELTVQAQLKKAFDLYVEKRLSKYSGWKKKRILEILEKTSITVSGYVAGVTGEWYQMSTIKLTVNREMHDTPYFFSAWVHELEHAIQDVDLEKFRVAYLHTELDRIYIREYGSVRSEYEFWQVLTPELKAMGRAVAQNLRQKELGSFYAELGDASDGSFENFRASHTYSSKATTLQFYQ